jgi:glycosyltransferase involved in cell wall biosynthesis
MRVCIDARILQDGYSGGTQQVIIGLASAYSKFTGDDEFLFLAYKGRAHWLSPYLQGACRLLEVPAPPIGIRRVARKLVGVGKSWLKQLAGNAPDLPRSDGIIERARIDVMHFVLQSHPFLTEVPTIYHPWDLQHIHLPDFFTPGQIAWRNRIYRGFCERSSLVSVASEWVKHDIVEHYQIQPEKIRVVPMGAVVESYQTIDPDIVRRKYNLPAQFLFYPAQTWPHKNHVRLLQALALLRDQRGLEIPLVCSGFHNQHDRTIADVIHNLGLQQVIVAGYVPAADLKAFYGLATALIFPSLFEGWGLPVTEAFVSGLPVLCSDVTSLPEQVGDAAVLFSPLDVRAIADAVLRVWTDEPLRREMVRKGYERAKRLTWDVTARQFYMLYQEIAGKNL